MIDLHCHILPQFDDGASSLDESLAMAHMAVASGVKGICATPHFRGDQQSLELVELLKQRYRELTDALRQSALPLELYPGAEVLCLPQTVDMAHRGQLPTLGNTGYLLTEFFFNESFENMDEILTGIAHAGYIPVVAHPERYEAIQRDPRRIVHWFRKGYIIQVNKGSILGALGHRSALAADWILSSGLAHLVASDAHSSSHRTTDMTALRSRLMEEYRPDYVQILTQHNPARLIRGEEMVPFD